MQRIATLDGWRGVAILMVLVDHGQLAVRGGSFSRWLGPTGIHGVGIFFVLSGYLITSHLMNERRNTGQVDIRAFYKRRFYRLMPAALLFLAVASLITFRQHRGGWIEIAGSLLFFRNYVDTAGIHPITGHFWSLSIEEQFYLLWPTLFVGVSRRRAVALLAGGVAVVAACRMFIAIYQVSVPVFETQYRLDGILIGCLLAFAVPQLTVFLRSWMAFPLLGLLVMCVYGNHVFVPVYESAVIAALIATSSMCSEGWLGRCLEALPLRVLGIGSYSLYLWQQLVVLSIKPTVRSLPAGLVVVGTLAAASYFLIERPTVRLGRKERKPAGHDAIAAAGSVL